MANVPTPMDVGIKGRSRVQVSQSGRIFDNRNPNQIVRNAEKSTEAVTNFLETVTEAGSQVYKGYLVEQGQRQAGELLATQDPIDLIRSGTEEDRNVVRSLNPFARDIINTAAAEGAAARYQEQYAANLTKNSPILTDPNASAEQKAEARSEAKRNAIQSSGLSAVDPAYVGQIAPQLAAVEGALDGKNYSDTLKRQKNQDRAKTQNGFRSSLNQMLEQNQGSSELSPEGSVAYKNWWEDAIKRQGAAWTPNELAGIIYDGLSTEVMRKLQNGEEQDAKELTDMMAAMSGLNVLTPSGASFFDIPLENGKTLGLAISELGDKVNGRARQAEGRNALESVRGIMDRAIQGEDVEDEIRAAAATLPTSALLSVLGDLEKAQNFGRKPTQAQIENAAELSYEIAAPGANRETSAEKLRAAYNSGQITTAQFAAGMTQIRDGSGQAMSAISATRQYLSGEFGVATAEIAKAANSSGVSIDPELMQRELSIDVSENVRKRAQEAADSGSPWTKDQYVEEMRSELETLRDARIDQISEGKADLPKSNNQRVIDDLNYFQKSVQESGGQVTLKSFPPELVEAAQVQLKKKDVTPREMLKFLSKRMQGVTENQKPLLPNSEKILKDIQRKAQKNAKNEQGVPTNQPLADNIIRLNQLIRQALPGGGGDSNADPVAGGQAKAKPATKSPVETASVVVQTGLAELARVLAPPAAAGTLDEMQNMPAVPTMNNIWKKQEPLTIETEPLPQVVAAASTHGVPLSIKHDKHPYFIAIGISEGTRTPSGGYTKAYYGHTDPGDGFANRGTVSGGRGMGNAGPQQVDRHWMGILTRKATTSAPILQRIGLRPGTQGWHRAMFNILDLTVQAPAAVPDFVRKLSVANRQGLTVEAIAKARADAFINPRTGRLEAGGFGNSYSRLLADQRSRAGSYDYKRRL